MRLYHRALSRAEVWALYDPRTRWDLYWRPSRRVFFEVGGTTTLDAGSQPVVVTAPTTTLSLGALTLSAGTLATVVTAPTTSLALGAVTLSAGDQPVVVTAPTATLVQGGATLAAGDQGAVVTAPAPAVGLGAVTVAAGSQPVVVTAPAVQEAVTLTSGVIRVEIGGTDRTSDTRVTGLSITRRVRATSTCQLVLHSTTAAWRPGLMDSLEVWQSWRHVTDAAITSGDKTLTSATAAFTAADVGAHVRIQNAAGSSLPRYATIASYTSATSVEIDQNAGATVSGKNLLIGTCRFRGYLNTVPETRIGTAASSREWRCEAVDLMAVARKLWVPTVFASSSATVMSHIATLVSDAATDEHGIVVVQTGGATLTWEDGPGWIYDLIDAAVARWTDDDGIDRWWTIDPLGRVVVYALNGRTYSGSDLTTANANVLLLPRTSRAGNEYWNRVTFTYAYSSGAYDVTWNNTTEQSALGGRVFERAPLLIGDASTSYVNTPSWITDSNQAFTEANAAAYVASLQAKVGRDAWTLELDTLQDGIEPGMIVGVDLSELGISSMDHYVQDLTSTWTDLADPTAGVQGRWRHRVKANGQQALYTTPWDRWRAWRP